MSVCRGNLCFSKVFAVERLHLLLNQTIMIKFLKLKLKVPF